MVDNIYHIELSRMELSRGKLGVVSCPMEKWLQLDGHGELSHSNFKNLNNNSEFQEKMKFSGHILYKIWKVHLKDRKLRQ